MFVLGAQKLSEDLGGTQPLVWCAIGWNARLQAHPRHSGILILHVFAARSVIYVDRVASEKMLATANCDQGGIGTAICSPLLPPIKFAE